MTSSEEGQLLGDPAPALLEGRIWVDGCFDFFHHGMSRIASPALGYRSLLGQFASAASTYCASLS
jgi:hypothetical protein